MIRSCDCKHEFQDKEHGVGNRVHTLGVVSGGMRPVRCTVCGKETRISVKKEVTK